MDQRNVFESLLSLNLIPNRTTYSSLRCQNKQLFPSILSISGQQQGRKVDLKKLFRVQTNKQRNKPGVKFLYKYSLQSSNFSISAQQQGRKVDPEKLFRVSFDSEVEASTQQK